MTVVGPSVPANLIATAVDSQINLSWASSTDSNALDSHGNPIVVAGYRIFRDGAFLATTTATTTTYADTGLSTATTYSYAIEAFDSIGAFSGQSALFPRRHCRQLLRPPDREAVALHLLFTMNTSRLIAVMPL